MKIVLLLLLTIPLTIFAGLYWLNDRQFYIISMLILVQAFLPFIYHFENRKPAARELVIVAVMCAIGVAGRGAFFMLPQFKPMVALVVISGAALGAERGFLIGAVTLWVSNMFFGQGPWTPWQMFALGLVGLFAGLIFYNSRGSENKKKRLLPIVLYGGFATLFIYGGIMNFAGVLIFQPQPTAQMFWLAFVVGLPFDLVHAVATVVFLSFTARPIMEKLDRIIKKYGILDKINENS